jgi:hypothetical protein
MVKTEINKQIDFFKAREKYKKDLKLFIQKHGADKMTPAMQRSIPANGKVLIELVWYLQPRCWFNILRIALVQADNQCIRNILNG